jgi:hypothetical protein
MAWHSSRPMLSLWLDMNDSKEWLATSNFQTFTGKKG